MPDANAAIRFSSPAPTTAQAAAASSSSSAAAAAAAATATAAVATAATVVATVAKRSRKYAEEKANAMRRRVALDLHLQDGMLATELFELVRGREFPSLARPMTTVNSHTGLRMEPLHRDAGGSSTAPNKRLYLVAVAEPVVAVGSRRLSRKTPPK